MRRPGSCIHLDRNPDPYIAILVRFSGEKPEGDESVLWTLLAEVVAALEELSWVKPRA